uniref:Uncharacterized protein n=1 Tax=Parascaris univalens TaxID=6257 RepID=A0A914ZUS8_PARUN
MTEAVRQSASVSTQVHPQWRDTSGTSLHIDASPSALRHGSLGVAVPSLFAPAAKNAADPSRLLKEQNVTVPTPRTSDRKIDYEVMSENKPKEDIDDDRKAVMPTNNVNVFFSGSDASLTSKTTVAEINWRNLLDSEEETSEDYDEAEEDSDGDDNGDKAGASDTETRNLLEDGADDEDDELDSDGANTINAAHSNASSQIAQMRAEKNVKMNEQRSVGVDDDSIFEMSEQQRDYYSKCFAYLIKATQGVVDMKGAVHGANEKVVDFFKKSNLGTETLSKIWALSDVNEDGFLDLAEFSAAMHLIVLNLKGGIAVPEHLPKSLCPPLTPPRNANPPSDESWRVQSLSSANKTPNNWRQFDFDESTGALSQPYHQQQQHSLSDDHLHLHNAKSEMPEHLSDFSDVPPLLVDGRPTALKATQPLICTTQVSAGQSLEAAFGNETLRLTLSPPAPKGPPPKPPPRPSNKGHARSASLDLNTLGSSAGIYAGIATAERGGTLPIHASLRFHPSPPTISESVRVPPPPALPQGGVVTPPVSARPQLAAPPPPRRTTSVDAQTQTDEVRCGQEASTSLAQLELIQFNVDMAMAGIADAHVNWKERCAQLQKLNAELELEKSKLLQIRLQLESKLIDTTTTPSSMKPTAL